MRRPATQLTTHRSFGPNCHGRQLIFPPANFPNKDSAAFTLFPLPFISFVKLLLRPVIIFKKEQTPNGHSEAVESTAPLLKFVFDMENTYIDLYLWLSLNMK